MQHTHFMCTRPDPRPHPPALLRVRVFSFPPLPSWVPSQEITEGAKIVYTYDVYWQNSNIKWASRWDAYLRMPGGKVREGCV
jgi:hypothetical protein